MILAILAGSKSQTRRPIKPQPPAYIERLHGSRMCERVPYQLEDDEGRMRGVGFQDDNDQFYQCPLGAPGDSLWVRECWRYAGFDDQGSPCIQYRSDMSMRWCEPHNDEWGEKLASIWEELTDAAKLRGDGLIEDTKWRPSIFMPRFASRIELSVKETLVERVADISMEDAKAEGVPRIQWGKCRQLPVFNINRRLAIPKVDAESHVAGFYEIWSAIYPPGSEFSFERNPYVWAVHFSDVQVAESFMEVAA